MVPAINKQTATIIVVCITYNFAIRAEDWGVLSHWWATGHKSHSFPLRLRFDLWNDDISSREIPHLPTTLTYNHKQQNANASVIGSGDRLWIFDSNSQTNTQLPSVLL